MSMHSEKFYNRLVSMLTTSKDLLFSHSMARADEAVLENLCLSAFNAHPYTIVFSLDTSDAHCFPEEYVGH